MTASRCLPLESPTLLRHKPDMSRIPHLALVMIALSGCARTESTAPADTGASAELSAATDVASVPEVAPDTAAMGPLPITAPPDTWTWVPFSDAFCANGKSTGIGLRPSSKSTDLLIFFKGGGACWDEQTCWKDNLAAFVVDGYGEPEFKSDLKTTLDVAIFDVDLADNPFRTWDMAFIPYCTGDIHGGSNPDAVHGAHPTRHVGHLNFKRYLARLVATFPDATRIAVIGTSAGGFGATLNVWHVRQAFPGVRVDLLSDSGPLLPSAFTDATKREAQRSAWKLDAVYPPDCTGCVGEWSGLIGHVLATTAASSGRAALLGYAQDAVIGSYFDLTASKVQEGYQAILASLADQPRFQAYLAPGGAHVVMWTLGTKSGGALGGFLQKMIGDDPGWKSVLP